MVLRGEHHVARARLRGEPDYASQDYVAVVSTREQYDYDGATPLVERDGPPPHIVVLDLGVKRSIMRNLRRRGCTVTAVPHDTDAESLLALRPDGIVSVTAAVVEERSSGGRH